MVKGFMCMTLHFKVIFKNHSCGISNPMISNRVVRLKLIQQFRKTEYPKSATRIKEHNFTHLI